MNMKCTCPRFVRLCPLSMHVTITLVKLIMHNKHDLWLSTSEVPNE